eukprot:m.123468 g.123468  ORF g.123468 m.123468 type:complete len:728 (-) comp28992_c0_seq2:144-2327(-)
MAEAVATDDAKSKPRRRLTRQPAIECASPHDIQAADKVVLDTVGETHGSSASSALPNEKEEDASPSRKKVVRELSYMKAIEKGDENIITVLCCTANIGNSKFDSVHDWIPLEGRFGDVGKHYDIIAIGMQEASFGHTSEDDDDMDQDSDAQSDEADTPEPTTPSQAEAPDKKSPESHLTALGLLKHLPKIAVPKIKRHDHKEPLVDEDHLDFSSQHIAQVLKDHLGPKYTPVGKNIKRGQMRLFAYANNDTVKVPPESIQRGKVNTGLGYGKLKYKNKGGQILKMTVLKDQSHTTLCFVSCHLAAMEGKKEKRNENIREIMAKAQIGRSQLDFGSQFDFAFWMGDMNYRIDTNQNSQSPKSKSSPTKMEFSKMWKHVHTLTQEIDSEIDSTRNAALVALWKADELMEGVAGLDKLDVRDVQLQGEMLWGWMTRKPMFKPTYKTVKDDAKWSYVEQRIPSWCDRVLWMALPGFLDRIQVLEYKASGQFNTSDHKPVRCGFTLQGTRRPLTSSVNSDDADADSVMKLAFSELKCFNIERDIHQYHGIADPFLKFYFDGDTTDTDIALRRWDVCKPKKSVLQSITAPFKTDKKAPKTTYKIDDLNPDWGDDKIFSKLFIAPHTPAERLKDCHIHIVCVDKVTGGGGYRLGSTSVNLFDVYESYQKNEDFCFEEQMTNNGKRTGVVMGRIHMHHVAFPQLNQRFEAMIDAFERANSRCASPHVSGKKQADT